MTATGEGMAAAMGSPAEADTDPDTVDMAHRIPRALRSRNPDRPSLPTMAARAVTLEQVRYSLV
jgi:hypothetical protein